MSELKVNKISPRSGTAVTLGDSGDTFTIPSGATLAIQGTVSGFTSAGIDDNATSVAITISSAEDVTFTEDILLGDSKKAIFGAGSDFQMYHDGNNSIITEEGGGNFQLRTNGPSINLQKGNSEDMAVFTADGAVSLYHDNSKKFETTSTGATITGNITATGNLTSAGIDDNATSTAITISSDERVTIDADDEKALVVHHNDGSIVRIGMNNDATNANEIAFDSSDFIVKPGGFEKFRINNSGNVGIGTSSPVTPLNVIGGSDLGIEVSDTSSGGNGVITIKGNATNGGSYLQFGDTDDDNVGRIYYTHDDNAMKFNTADAERMRIDSSGAVSIATTSAINGEKLKVQGKIYINAPESDSVFTTGACLIFPQTYNNIRQSTDHALNFDTYNGGSTLTPLTIMQDGKIGIGTASPTGILECKSAGNTQVYITAGNSSASELFFGDAADVDVGKITYLHGDNAMKFQTNTSEAMRIDSSGRLLFGKTSSDNAVPGVKLSGGQIIGTVANDDIMILNRTGSDGKILRFFKDTSEVGSIRAEGGDIVVGNDTRGLKYRDTDFIPRDMDNTTSDNQVTLGSSGSRFADIYLGGGAFIGGTGTANKLDDYEEGTWTPAYTGSTTTGTGVTGAGQYTKIGNLVHVDFGFVNVTTSGAAGDLRITGLPFTVSNATTRGSFAGNIRFYNHDLAGNTYYQLTPVADGSTTYIVISQTRDNASWSVVQIDNDSGLYIEGGITYTTTS